MLTVSKLFLLSALVANMLSSSDQTDLLEPQTLADLKPGQAIVKKSVIQPEPEKETEEVYIKGRIMSLHMFCGSLGVAVGRRSTSFVFEPTAPIGGNVTKAQLSLPKQLAVAEVQVYRCRQLERSINERLYSTQNAERREKFALLDLDLEQVGAPFYRDKIAIVLPRRIRTPKTSSWGNVPVLHIVAERTPDRRTKRVPETGDGEQLMHYTSDECTDDNRREQCCLQRLDFDRYEVEPGVHVPLSVRVCVGVCPRPYGSSLHSIQEAVEHFVNGSRPLSVRPCCKPTQFNRVQFFYKMPGSSYIQSQMWSSVDATQCACKY